MAISLPILTGTGLATYHMVGLEVYEDATPAAWCLLLSYTDRDARLNHAQPLMQTRIDLPDWDGVTPDPLNGETGKPAFYAYIATLPQWAAGEPVLDVEPAPDGLTDSDD